VTASVKDRPRTSASGRLPNRRVLITCEHAGHRVPAEYARLFDSRRARRALLSHRGYDPGAVDIARLMARRLGAPRLEWTVTRLLVEINRSVGHPRLFSEFSRSLSSANREAVLRRYYTPHRERVGAAVEEASAGGAAVLHVGVHSFTPRLGDEVRNADIGLLYDPARPVERRLCLRWQAALECASGWVVRRNYPYRGNADGLTTALRRRFPRSRYLGIELEINQARLVGCRPRDWAWLADVLVRSLREAMAD
jgi:predicted N-formylglutamate amidohydrolase